MKIISFEIILTPLLTLVVVQALKLAFDGIKGNFNFKNLVNTYGGMPSSHTAFVVSLCTIVGYRYGPSSGLFAVCIVFSLLIISDALIFRRHVSHYGQTLLKLVNKLPEQEKRGLPLIDKELGHSLLQVLVGAAVGFIVAFIIQLLY